MTVIQKLSRRIATTLFTVALGDVFDWVQSVPEGQRPRYSNQGLDAENAAAPELNGWTQPTGLKPTVS